MVELIFFMGFFLPHGERVASPRTKKADVAEHPQVFHHVGLLINGPPGMAGLLFI
jgi:hypothetical protein